MKFPILQSGFIGLNNEGLVRTEPIDQDRFIRAIELGKPVDSKGNAFFYNKDIEDLYNRFANDRRLLRQFEFREEIFRLAKIAFGNINMETWFTLQLESPYLTTMHRRFLNDTMEYIYSGNREVSSENWMGIIYPRDATVTDTRTELLVQDYFGGRCPKLNRGFIDLIAQWTHQTYGVTDLLSFLAIVFSKHSATTV